MPCALCSHLLEGATPGMGLGRQIKGCQHLSCQKTAQGGNLNAHLVVHLAWKTRFEEDGID